MRIRILLGISSSILLVFTIIVGTSRYGLVLAEYGGTLGFSELHYTPVIYALFPICVGLTVVFITLFLLCFKHSLDRHKYSWIVFIVGLIITITVIISTIFISYETAIFDEHRTDYSLSDEESIRIDPKYKEYFPYYDLLYENVGTEFNYRYYRCEIPQAVHIHIQNFSWYENDMLYDAEYFKSNNNSLFLQYSAQKNIPVIFTEETQVYPKGTTKTLENTEYIIYQYNNYFEIRILDNNSFFSIVIKDFNEMLKIDENAFTDLAIKQYKLIQRSANNTVGSSRKLLDEL